MKQYSRLLGCLPALFLSAGLSNLPGQTSDQSNANSGPSAPAQATPTTAVASAQPDQNSQVVQMSAFEVTTTQGSGYVATTAAMAFKTHEALMDIPQGDVVVTSDFIRDIGYENITDTVQYFGVAQNIEGATMQMRGTSVLNYPYIDEIPTGEYYHDEAMVDSYEIVKGPAESLYLGAGSAGVVIEVTKKPLSYQQDIVTVSIDQWGLYRTTLDSTGPLGALGDFDFSYRLVAAYEHGNEYFNNTRNDRYMLFPEFRVKYKNTAVRAYWNPQSVNGPPGMAFLTPNGNIETGMGWRAENQYSPGNVPWTWQGRTLYLEILQKISDNWESRLSAMDWRYDIDSPGEFAINVNYDNDTETWGDERTDEHWADWTVLDDYQGHYELGPESWKMKNSDIFGFGYQSTTDKQFYFFTAPFPWPNGPIGGTVTIPFDDPAALYAIPVPPANDIPPPSAANWSAQAFANDIEIQTSAIYWQHTIDPIPNWLSLITGWTWDNIASQSVTDWAVLPWTGTNISVSQWTHRFGAVIHLGKSISLYALDSNNVLSPQGVTLENGTEPPPQQGSGTEIGLKWNFFNGKITGESAWFKLVTSNGLNLSAGQTPQGANFAAVIGSITEEGVDGDAAFSLVPGWQLIGSWYAGHEVTPFGTPTPSSFDNSLSLFTRYDCGRPGLLRGLALGGGLSRTGGRWEASGAAVGQISSTIAIPSVTKIQSGTMVNAFVSYQVNKHWGIKVSVANLLDENFPLAFESSPLYIDPSEPRDFTFSTSYKF